MKAERRSAGKFIFRQDGPRRILIIQMYVYLTRKPPNKLYLQPGGEVFFRFVSLKNSKIMRTTILSIFLFLGVGLFAQQGRETPALNVIPEPVAVKQAEGQFVISRDTRIYAADREAEKSARYFIDYFNRNYGYELALGI